VARRDTSFQAPKPRGRINGGHYTAARMGLSIPEWGGNGGLSDRLEGTDGEHLVGAEGLEV
jgi:hypothetical protein